MNQGTLVTHAVYPQLLLNYDLTPLNGGTVVLVSSS